ncbi:MAG TPA: glycosyltransferase 87 family protein [Thermoanaerobaculia bacterium]|nr:glycosyltransferase 87 family protein [Thermoanaerobaculia bacterium]
MRHRFAFILLALVAATIFIPALVTGEVFSLRDHFDYFQPLRFFTAEQLLTGKLPFWNPYSASGEPWFANPQTGVFYPPAWLFLILPFPAAYMLFLLAHLVILGWGAYLLFSRTASEGAAIAGAAALMFSGPVLSLLDVQNNLATLAWIPLALWCAAEGAWRRGGLVLALAFLGGEPFFAALAALLYLCVRRKRDVLGTGLVAFGISAVQLLPFLEFVSTSDRVAGMGDALILRDSMSAGDWLRVAVPGPTQQQFIPVVYMGLVVLVLALIGSTTARRSSATRAWLALLAGSILISMGPHLLTRLPLTLFRYPARLVPIAAIAVAALAVVGWERVRPNRRWVDLVIVLALVADLLPRAASLLQTAEFRRDVVPYPMQIGARGKMLRFGEVDPRHRLAWMSGYLNLYDHRFDAFTAAPLASERYLRMYRQLLERPTFENFANAGIVHIFTRYELPPPWFAVASAENVWVYENRQAFPMAAHFSPGSHALRHASWTLDTSSARISVNAPRDGVLVLRQQAARGWKVTVDGVPAQALVIDGVFRGVDVRAGRHEIVWMYDPPLFFAGCVMTIITLLALQISVFVKRSR